MNGALHSFIGAMVADQDEESAIHPIDERAQAMELRDRFRRAFTATVFEPDLFYREKRGMAVLKSPRLLMFWRWLDPGDAQDALIIARSAQEKAVNRTDCMVGFLDHDGGLIVLDHESWRLEPCDEFPGDPLIGTPLP